MIQYANKELFMMDSVDKQLNISYEGGEITNSELAKEDFALTEKLTSKGTLILGDCNASYIEFSVGYGTDALEGKKLTVTITPKDAEAFKIGEYKVVSDKPTADRRWRKITAYDAMYDILNEDVTEWFDTILPAPEEGEDPTSVTLKQFRDSFFEHVGVTQATVDLPSDGLVLTRMAEFKTLTGKAVVNAICEINGCFGHVDRDSVFQYVFLKSPSEPLYPSLNLYPSHDIFPKAAGEPIEIGIGYRYKYPLPQLIYPSHDLFPSEDLFPRAYQTEQVDGLYMSVNYESYFTKIVTGIQIKNDKNDPGITVGNGNIYVIEGNFLAYGQTDEVLTQIANRILEKLAGIYYCPSDIKAQGNPTLQIGDPIVLHTRYATIETIIFQRKLKGIQFLVDTYTSKGQKELRSDLNGTSKQISDANAKITEVKADLVTAKKVIAEQIEADEARIGYIESNYVQTSTLVANYATITSLETVDGKIDNLTSIAITTTNLSAQSISGNQITAGTVATARLDVGSIAAQTVTASTISAALVSPDQGSMTIGTVRAKNLYWYTDLTGGNNPTYHQVSSTLINGTRVLTVS